MIESCITSRVALSSNADAVSFQRDTIRTRACWLCSRNEGFPIYKIKNDKWDCATFEIEFNATVTSAAAGIIAFGVYQDRNFITLHNQC